MSPALFTDRTLGFLVSDIARLLRRSMDRRLQSLGLTQAQWRAIVHLSRSEGSTQATLAESLEIQPITLTRLIDRMESAGWVERRTHPLDRRAVQLYLTPQSQPILEEMHARAADTLSEATLGVRAARAAATRRDPRANQAQPHRRGIRGGLDRAMQELLVMADQEPSPPAPAPSGAVPCRHPCRAAAAARAAGCARRCCSWGRSLR